MNPMFVKDYQGYIFDLDGTIYLGGTLLPTALDTISILKSRGKEIIFLSNNPTQTRRTYAEKLTRLGIHTTPEEVINSSYVMVNYLRRNLSDCRLFVIGEPPLINEIQAAGFRLTSDPGEIDIVIASFDRTFSYQKLQIAFDAIRSGARFIATNADRFCPIPGGGQPDAAAVIAAVEACTNKSVEVIVGKPSQVMANAIFELLELPPEHCLITGDRIETDILLGLNAGMDSALVMTGATNQTTLEHSKIKPTYTIQQLSELLNEYK